MDLGSVAVLGGGPGGLFAARLLKLRHPGAAVTVYEQEQPDGTFGFGVGLAAAIQRQIGVADPACFAAITRAASGADGASISVRDHTLELGGHGEIGIGRTALLAELRDLALGCGVEIEYGRRQVAELVADVVIAADGVGSATRTLLAEQLGVTITVGSGLYLWCGTDFTLNRMRFVPKRTEFGVFTAHAYPYAPNRSTLLIETDETCWRAAGFEESTARLSAGDSDDSALRYLGGVFADELGGHELKGNRTRWSRFRTVHCERWSAGNIVLLGDAAHTAHYSVGSGTKLAMEDAIALDEAVAGADDLAAALNRYQLVRQDVVLRLQRSAHLSEQWWDTMGERLDLPVATTAFSYLTRTGRFDLDRAIAAGAAVTEQAVAEYAGQSLTDAELGDPTEWVLSRPLRWGASTFPGRVVGAGDLAGIEVVVTDRDIRDPASAAVWFHGSDDLDSVLSRLASAERLRRRNPDVLTIVEAPVQASSHLAAALVAQRTHLVSLSDAAIDSTRPSIS